MAKAYEYRDLTQEQLEERIVEQSEAVMTARLKLGARTLDNPLDFKTARRDLARMKTVLNEKRREAAKESQ